MDQTALQQALSIKETPNLDDIAQLAIVNKRTLQLVLNGLTSKQNAHRYNCFQVLYQISGRQPHVLYPAWAYFVTLLSSPNAYHRAAAVCLIADLTRIDDAQQFETIFERYFDLLDDEKVVVARYLAQNAWKIAEAKPDLREKITARLLDIDATHHPPSHKALVKADIITSFKVFFQESKRKEGIRAFVEAQLESESPKARQAANTFLRRYGQ